jgi:hypothetical protein
MNLDVIERDGKRALVFLRAVGVLFYTQAVGDFASLFGATKNYIPLKEAPNVLAKCVLAYTQVCAHSLVGRCIAPEILMALI